MGLKPAVAGRSQRAEGIRALAIFRHILGLGMGVPRQHSLPQTGPAEPEVREARLGQGFWDAVIHAPYVAHMAPTSPLLGCSGPFRVTPKKEEQPGNTRRVS